MKPETACEKVMNETFVQIIHLLNNLERRVLCSKISKKIEGGTLWYNQKIFEKKSHSAEKKSKLKTPR